jgi:glycosyltransferase involved in cell wall biosynthesis
MKIDWFSPLPPHKSGIGEYSVQLLPFVAEEADVTDVCPSAGLFKKIQTPPGIDWITPEKWKSRPQGDAVPIYHLGNNAYHRYCYEAAMKRPGVSVFHDIVMHHMLADVLVENPGPRKHWDIYERILRNEYGETGTRLSELRMRGIASDFEKFLFPLFAHIAKRSRVIVTHSDEMRDRIAWEVPDVPIHVIPHFAPPRPDELKTMTKESARRVLNLPQGAPIVGFLGYVTTPKQPEAVIEGFARLARERPDARLVLVGRDHTGGRLARWTDRPELEGKIRLTGFVDLIEFYRYLLACDVVVNLRYPTVVESSGTNARALAEGRPLVVSNVGAFAELPDDACCKVEIDEDQGAAVGKHLLRLFKDQAYMDSIVQKGLEYAEQWLDSREIGHAFVEAARAAHDRRPATAAS